MAVMPLARKIVLLLAGIFIGFLPTAVVVPAAAQEREPAFQDNFYDVQVRGHQCWIVGYYGTILHSNDRGLTWELQRSGAKEALFRVVFLDEKRGWISGSYGTIFHTSDGGRNWRIQSTPTQQHLFGLNFVSERLGWAVGSQGTILHTEDGGASWANRPLGEDVILNDVLFIGRNQGWVVGEFGRIYNTRDGGLTWAKQQSPVEVSFVSGESRNLFRLLFPDSRAGWAFGLDGVILKTQNGEGWEITHKNGATAKLTDHHLFAAAQFNGMLWAVGERGTVIVSPMGNNNWQKAEIKSPPLSFNGIDFGPDGLGLIVGNRGLIFRTEDGGKQWKRIRIVPERPGKGIGRVQ